MNQRSEDPNRNIDIGIKGGTNQSGIQNLEVSSNFEGPSNISGSIGENKNTGIVMDQGGSYDRSQGGYLQSEIFKKSRDQDINCPENKDNNSGRSLS